MDLQVRAAGQQDKTEILRVIGNTQAGWDKRYAKRYYDDYFSNDEPSSDEVVYVGSLNGNIVGVIGYYRDRDETKNVWLGWFYVDREKQGEGNGKRLFNHVISQLKNISVKRLYVYTSSHESYLKALIFYLRNGFRIESVMKNYYGDDEDQITLSKAL